MQTSKVKGKIMDDNIGGITPKGLAITPVARASYAFILEPRPADDDETEKDRKYGISLIFEKSADLKPLMKVLIKAAQNKWGDASNMPPKLVEFLKAGKSPVDSRVGYPIHSGDEKDGEEYHGKMFFNCSSYMKPKFVEKINGKAIEITDPEKARSGNYVRCSVKAKAYEYKGAKGVRFELVNVMFIRIGDPLGSGSDPEDDFSEYGDSEQTDPMTTSDLSLEDDDIPFDKPGQAETLDESLFD